MFRKTKSFSCSLLMLILLMNLSSFMHTVLHIQISPEVFCIAQHNENYAPHFESACLQLSDNNECTICQYNRQNNSSDFNENFFFIPHRKIEISSFFTYTFDYVRFFHISSRAPPFV